MVGAKALLEGIRQDLQPVTEQLLRHPYVQALEEGKIGREKLRLFAGEQYSIIASDLKSVAYLLSRFGSAPSRDFFLGILQGERAAWDALLTFADALGLSEAQLSEHEPRPALMPTPATWRGLRSMPLTPRLLLPTWSIFQRGVRTVAA